MAMRVEGFEDTLRMFDSCIDNTDKAIKEALILGGQELNRNTREAVHEAANAGYATGELEKSITPTKPIKNNYGQFVAVRPTGTDSKGVRNGAKWGYLQFGNGRPNSRKHDFKSKAIKASEKKCIEIAQETLNKYMK